MDALGDLLKLLPDRIPTAWLAPVVVALFGAWIFVRRQKELERRLDEKTEAVHRLESALEQQRQSNQLLHQGLAGLQQQKESLDSLLADARGQLRASADSIIIRHPYSDRTLVFLMAHGPAAASILRMQVDLHGTQAGAVFLSRETSFFSAAAGGQVHDRRLDTKSGFTSRNILTKALVRFGSEVVGVVQFLNEDPAAPFTPADEARIEPICAKMAHVVGGIVADPANLIQLGVVLDPQIHHATVVFTDITGSDLLFRTLPVADATALVDEYLTRLGTIGARHGARIDKNLGDGIMLSFESPAQPNARQAVAASVAMQREFDAIRREWERLGYPLAGLDHRIGIASGPVFGRRMGHGQSAAFTIMGLPVNHAAHLCEAARHSPARILLSQPTRDELGTDLPPGAVLRAYPVDGVPAWELLPGAG